MPKKTPSKPAGYSGTPLAKKLGIKSGHRVVLINAPAGFEDNIEGLPDDVVVSRGTRGGKLVDVIVLFCKDRKVLNRDFDRSRDRLDQAGGLWLAWPKKASGIETDLNDNIVREFGLSFGLVDNKVCAIDATWSGLRFVVRVKDRR